MAKEERRVFCLKIDPKCEVDVAKNWEEIRQKNR